MFHISNRLVKPEESDREHTDYVSYWTRGSLELVISDSGTIIHVLDDDFVIGSFAQQRVQCS